MKSFPIDTHKRFQKPNLLLSALLCFHIQDTCFHKQTMSSIVSSSGSGNCCSGVCCGVVIFFHMF